MRVRIDEIHPDDDDPRNLKMGEVLTPLDILPAALRWGASYSRVYFQHPEAGRMYTIARWTQVDAPGETRTTDVVPIERVCPRSPETCCQSEPCRGPVPLFMSADSEERKLCPVTTGFDAYFPDAKLCVAFVSRAGNEKHNPGQPLHWDKSKSADEKDAEGRHMLDALRGLPPDPGLERLGKLGHLASKAWRAMADLQRACDEERKAYEDGV